MRNTFVTKVSFPTGARQAPGVVTLSTSRGEAWRQGLVVLALNLSDGTLAFVAWGVACLAQTFWLPGYLSGVAVATIVPVALVWVGLRAIQGLYPGYGLNEAEELRRQTYALLAALAFAAVFALAFQIGNTTSWLLASLVFSSLLLLSPLMRHFVKGRLKKHGIWGKPVIIVGSSESGARVEELLKREWALGYRPVAVFDGQTLDNYRVDTIFLAMPRVPREYLVHLASLASAHFRNVVMMPDLVGVTSSAVVARDFAGTLGVEIRHSLLDPTVQRAKRILDITATVLGGLLISPLILLLSGLVWLESRGPVFYSAQRMGRNGRTFACIKFRTMVPEAEVALEKMLQEDPKAREEYHKYHKLKDDPRVTRVGRFLRNTSLDELPQLWNVLWGEMSLVGPRPYLLRESDEIGATQDEILRVSPGITGPWQVGGRSGTSFGERVQIDAHYVRSWSIWIDLVLLARTARCILFRRGAF